MKYGFGVDLGGTTVKIAYFDQNGTMLAKWEIPTVTTGGGQQILPDIAASIKGYMDEHDIAKSAIVGIGIIYILARSAGKIIGAYLSTRATHCPPAVCKYLGITLLPQAGVALGMCITARQLGPQGDLIRNIILFAVLIYELVGPLMTKEALTAAGDITPKPDHIKNRRARMLVEFKGKTRR